MKHYLHDFLQLLFHQTLKLFRRFYLHLTNIYNIFFNEADDNNIEEPRRAICTGALIF